MNQSEHQARAGPSHHHAACFNERQKHHSNGLDHGISGQANKLPFLAH